MDEDIVTEKEVAAGLTHNLYAFLRFIVYGGDEHSQLNDRTHKKMCATASDWRYSRRKLILMPRGSFKSSCVTIGYSIQQICKNPNIRILIGSEVNATAKKFLREIKDHFESNDRIQHLYGNHVRAKGRWTDDEITSRLRKRNLKEPTIFTTGTDQTRTGMHCDLAILDDPVSATNINTKESREKTLQWYREISNNILEPDGHLIIIGTRWHFNDLYQYILDEEVSDYEVVTESAITERGYKILVSDISLEDKRRYIKENELLFPERLAVNELWAKYKSVGSTMFANQYLNKVMADEDADFREDYIQWYDPQDEEMKMRLRGVNKYIFVDPAISYESTADNTAIICIGIDEVGNWYVLDYDNDKMKPKEIIDKTFDMYKRHPGTLRVGIEVAVYQKSLVFNFRDEERNRMVKLPIAEVKPDNQVSKESRIRGVLQPLVEQRRLFLQHGMKDLFEQLKTFPRTRNDDVIDALSNCSRIMLGFRKNEGRGTMPLTRAQRDDKRDKYIAPEHGGHRSRFTKY